MFRKRFDYENLRTYIWCCMYRVHNHIGLWIRKQTLKSIKKNQDRINRG